MFAKSPQHRSEAWRRAVASLPCACCMREGATQAAHPNHRGELMDAWILLTVLELASNGSIKAKA
jgi:hypothetical protein